MAPSRFLTAATQRRREAANGRDFLQMVQETAKALEVDLVTVRRSPADIWSCSAAWLVIRPT